MKECRSQHPHWQTGKEVVNKQDGTLSALLLARTKTWQVSIFPPTPLRERALQLACLDISCDPISPLFFLTRSIRNDWRTHPKPLNPSSFWIPLFCAHAYVHVCMHTYVCVYVVWAASLSMAEKMNLSKPFQGPVNSTS